LIPAAVASAPFEDNGSIPVPKFEKAEWTPKLLLDTPTATPAALIPYAVAVVPPSVPRSWTV